LTARDFDERRDHDAESKDEDGLLPYAAKWRKHIKPDAPQPHHCPRCDWPTYHQPVCAMCSREMGLHAERTNR
jgi:hypothetical protein